MALRFQKILTATAATLVLAAALPALQPAGVSAAYARGDHGGGSDNSGRGGHDDSSGDDHGGHGDGNSGRGRGGDDDNGGDRHGGRTANSTDDNQRPGRQGGRADRARIALTVSDASLQGLLDGSLVAKDQLGRTLEVEVEFEHGVRTVEAKPHRSDAFRNPGPITSVSITPVSAP